MSVGNLRWVGWQANGSTDLAHSPKAFEKPTQIEDKSMKAIDVERSRGTFATVDDGETGNTLINQGVSRRKRGSSAT